MGDDGKEKGYFEAGGVKHGCLLPLAWGVEFG